MDTLPPCVVTMAEDGDGDGGGPALDLAEVLSRGGADQVPTRFIQPLQRRPTVAPPLDLHATPTTIDWNINYFCDGDGDGDEAEAEAEVEDGEETKQRIAEQVSKACQEWGFFQVVNHGIPSSLIEDVRNLVKGFFELPMEEKLKRPMKFGPPGHHPTGYGRLFDYGHNVLDWVDALIHYLSPPSLKDPAYWPHLPEGYRPTIEAYGMEVQRFVTELLEILSASLGLSSKHLETMFGGENAQVVMRVNHYPKCPQADQVLGLSPHSDAPILTVLLQDVVEGLQVKKDGTWWTVKPIPGALFVNMGDMMELASNARFKSPEHQVVVHKDVDKSIGCRLLCTHNRCIGWLHHLTNGPSL